MTPHEPFRGIFPILQTPFREDDTIDVACLRREVWVGCDPRSAASGPCAS